MLNNFLGASWNPGSDAFHTDVGMFGEEQLQWFEGEPQEGKPTLVFVLFPLAMGSTRYDQDAYIVAEVDQATGELMFLNENLWQRRSINSDPYSVG